MFERDNIPNTKEYMQEIRTLHDQLVEICAMSLREAKTADLRDKKILIRAIMRDAHDYGLYVNPSCDFSAEECAIDMWVDKVEYIDNNAFYLYLTQAEPNIFWNIEREGEIPERIEDAKMCIAVRCNDNGETPFIPVAYLLALALKLAVRMIEERPETETAWTEYLNGHRTMWLTGIFQPLLAMAHDD